MSTVTTHSELRETGEPWCPEVPRAWQFLPIRRLGTMLSGGTPTADDENWGGDVPFVTPPDLRQVTGGVVTVAARSLTRRGAQTGSSVAPAEAILVSIRAPIGYVARTGQQMAFNQGCRAIIPGDSLDAHFLTYALLAAAPELDAQGRGTTFMELSATQLANVPMPVPPLPEQRAIADFLDRETGQIDRLIGKQERLVETLLERRAAVLDHVVTRGLGPLTDMRDTHSSWLGEIPAHWEVRPLWSMFQRVKDVDHPDEAMLSVFRDHGVVYKHSRANLNVTAENRGIYQLVHPGWLVTNRMKAWQGSVGISQLRGIVSGHYICFAPRHSEDDRYLNYLFRSPRYTAGYRLISRGVRIGQAEIDNDDYRLMPVVVPPLAEQRAIADYFDDQTTKIDHLIARAQRFIELAKERRAALITAAVTGRIDVRGAA